MKVWGVIKYKQWEQVDGKRKKEKSSPCSGPVHSHSIFSLPIGIKKEKISVRKWVQGALGVGGGGEGSEKEETAVPLPTNTPTHLAPCYL